MNRLPIVGLAVVFVSALCLFAGCGDSAPAVVPKRGVEAGLRSSEPVLEVLVRSSNGSPVPGVRVRLETAAGKRAGSGPREAVTGADGLALFAAPLPAECKITLVEVPDQYEQYEFLPDGTARLERKTSVSLKGPWPFRVQFTLSPGGGLVVVADRGSLPAAAEARVEVSQWWPDGILRPLARTLVPIRAQIRDPAGGGSSETFSFRGLPAGRYLVKLHSRERTTVAGEAIVSSGTDATIRLAVGPAAAPVRITYRGPVPQGWKGCRLNMNGWDDALFHDVAFCMFLPGEDTREFRSLRRGKYMAILWDLGLAMVVDLEGRDAVELVPPESGADEKEGVSVSVSVTRADVRVGLLFVGLAPDTPTPLAHGTWMRYSEIRPGATFRGVRPGRYSVVVLDGVMGAVVGFGAPAIRRIEVGAEPLEVEIKLP